MIEFIEKFSSYNTEVVIIAVIICLIVGIIKKYISASYKKYLTFAPFVCGLVLYAAYMLISGNHNQILSFYTLQKGLECGAASTILYIVYEQFVRNKSFNKTDYKTLAVKNIIKPLVREEYLEQVTENIIIEIKEHFDDLQHCILICSEALKDKKQQNVTIIEIQTAAMLISSLLKMP